jgi:hypothetical protein
LQWDLQEGKARPELVFTALSGREVKNMEGENNVSMVFDEVVMHAVIVWKMGIIKNFLDNGTTDPLYISKVLKLDVEDVKEAIAIHLDAEELCNRMLSSECQKREERDMEGYS